jgi:hypothetical protein
MRPLSKLLTGSVAFAVVVGLIAAAGPAADANTVRRADAQLTSHATVPAWEKAVEHLKIGMPMTARSSAAGCPPGTTKENSTTWAGYAVCPPSSARRFGARYAYHSQHSLDSVAEGKWSTGIPHCDGNDDCPPPRIALFAVGLGGLRRSTIQEDGSGIYQSEGGTEYFTWWEMYPSTTIHVVGTTVRPGDRISSSVKENGTHYTLSVTDSTTPGNSFTVTTTCGDCDNSSAEWIAQGSGTDPIPDFGKWTVTDATAKFNSASGSILAFPHVEITLVNSSGTVLIQPGPLNGRGNGFTDVWKASS